MSLLKDEKVKEIIRELSSEYINLESNRNSLITVTRVEIGGKGKHATIYFSTLPESEEENTLAFLKRHAGKLRSFLLKKKAFAFSPAIHFEIDFGEKNRQRIDELVREDIE